MKIIITILLVGLLLGCGAVGSSSCYWDYGKREDRLLCYDSFGGWKVKSIVHKKHKHRHGHKHKRHWR